MKIDLNQIVPNPNQPRKYFDSEYIKELAGSIKENGLSNDTEEIEEAINDRRKKNETRV